MKDVFSASGGAWGYGDVQRRHPEMIAYRSLPRHPQSDLCRAGGSYLLDRRC